MNEEIINSENEENSIPQTQSIEPKIDNLGRVVVPKSIRKR